MFAEEDDVGFHEAVAGVFEAMRDGLVIDGFAHAVFGVRGFALDACMSRMCRSSDRKVYDVWYVLRKTPMRLYDLVPRYSRLALQTVNVLREDFQQ